MAVQVHVLCLLFGTAAGICTTDDEHFAPVPTNYCSPIDRLSERSEMNSTDRAQKRQGGASGRERKS